MPRHARTSTPLLAPALLFAAMAAIAAPPADLRTHAEATGFVETGRYAETLALCEAFAARYPAAVRCDTFGTTPEGRPMAQRRSPKRVRSLPLCRRHHRLRRQARFGSNAKDSLP